MNETTYDKYQFYPANETNGRTNDGVVTVTMSDNHPNTEKTAFFSFADQVIREADAYVNFASFDDDSNGKLGEN